MEGWGPPEPEPDAAPKNARHKCGVCGMSFMYPNMLKTHEPFHAGEQKYSCSGCRASFRKEEALDKHLRLHCRAMRRRGGKGGRGGSGGEGGGLSSAVPQLTATRQEEAAGAQAGGSEQVVCAVKVETSPLTYLKEEFVDQSLGTAEEEPQGQGPDLTSLDAVQVETHQLLLITVEALAQCAWQDSGGTPAGGFPPAEQPCADWDGHCNTVQEPSAGSGEPQSAPAPAKVFKCTKCDQTFPSKNQRDSHHRATHARKYRCIVCDKRFGAIKQLKYHYYSHTGEKPYKCSDCGAGFRSPDVLRVHRTIHTDERPYHCSYCGDSFRLKLFLQKHLLTHTGKKLYVCGQCGCGFREIRRLTMHKYTHMPRKPYGCPFCDQRFWQLKKMQIHRRTHPPELRFGRI